MRMNLSGAVPRQIHTPRFRKRLVSHAQILIYWLINLIDNDFAVDAAAGNLCAV